MRVAVDIGGVLSKYPDWFREWLGGQAAGGIEVFVLTDIHDRAQVLDMLGRNGFLDVIPAENVYVSDYQAYGEACKAVLCRDLGVAVLIDDHPGYLVWPWPGVPAPLRLQVLPDVTRPYYATGWRTDGSEGDFGRRAYYGGSCDGG
jgi:hypothetical protein